MVPSTWRGFRTSTCPATLGPWAVLAIRSRTKFSNTFQRLSHLHSNTPGAAILCFIESKSPLLRSHLVCSADLSHVGPSSISCVSQVCLLRREPAARWIQRELGCPRLFHFAWCAPPCLEVFRHQLSQVFSTGTPFCHGVSSSSGHLLCVESQSLFCLLGALHCRLRDPWQLLCIVVVGLNTACGLWSSGRAL